MKRNEIDSWTFGLIIYCLLLLALFIGMIIFSAAKAEALETGIYFVIQEDADEVDRLMAVPVIKDAGIDYIITYVHENDEDFVAACDAVGLGIIAERADRDIDGTRLAAVLTKYPYIERAGTFDDVDGKDNNDPADVEAMNTSFLNRLREYIYVSGGYPTRIAKYFNLGENAIGMQAYPVPYEPISAAWEAYWPAMSGYGGDFFPILQAFKHKAANRGPTPEELLTMADEALKLKPAGLYFYEYEGAVEAGLWPTVKEIVGWVAAEPTPTPTPEPTPAPTQHPCCDCVEWLVNLVEMCE